jgi:hypothetical protein
MLAENLARFLHASLSEVRHEDATDPAGFLPSERGRGHGAV